MGFKVVLMCATIRDVHESCQPTNQQQVKMSTGTEEGKNGFQG